MAFTEEQKRNYIRNAGQRCPFCDSDNLDHGQIGVEMGEAWQHVRCIACEKIWTEYYDLANISDHSEHITP